MTAAEIPAPRCPAGPYRIALVCLGNICRSPMAAVVLSAKLTERGRASDVVVHSAGTGDWHVGEPMDGRAAATLESQGYDPSLHRAHHFDAAWHRDHDLVLVMDQSNLRDVTALAPDESARQRTMLLRAFDPQAEGTREVPDPWYGGRSGFEDVLAMIDSATDGLVEALNLVAGRAR